MIYLYLFSLVLGGVLLGTTILLGGHGEVSGDGSADAGGDPSGSDGAGHGGGGAAPDDAGHAGVESFLVAFLSMRYRTDFLAFFGLTGLVLDGFGLVGSEIVAGVLSVGMGLACGTGAVYLMRKLITDESNSVTRSSDYIGKSGRVLVAFGPGQTGKVRLEVRGSSVDLLAVPFDGNTFEAKEEVIVVDMDATRAKVARMTPDMLERISKP